MRYKYKMHFQDLADEHLNYDALEEVREAYFKASVWDERVAELNQLTDKARAFDELRALYNEHKNLPNRISESLLGNKVIEIMNRKDEGS